VREIVVEYLIGSVKHQNIRIDLIRKEAKNGSLAVKRLNWKMLCKYIYEFESLKEGRRFL